jgi:hypothetical protein
MCGSTIAASLLREPQVQKYIATTTAAAIAQAAQRSRILELVEFIVGAEPLSFSLPKKLPRGIIRAKRGSSEKLRGCGLRATRVPEELEEL